MLPHTDTLPKAIIVGCAGPVLTEDEHDFFRDFDPLGFILFARNCETPDQVRTLTSSLRACVGRDDAPILIDMEGGRIAILQPPHWPKFPPMRVFGDLYAKDAAAALIACCLNATLIAYELAELGITVDCAPVIDLYFADAHDVIGDRAFGYDPHIVAALGGEVCKGLLAGGVTAIIKHVPGHGRATADSHDELPVVDTKRDILDQTDFLPFQLLAKNAECGRPWAMGAHVKYSAVDPDQPATTSRIMIDEVIRGHMGFDGILIADNIGMAALTGTLAERAEATLACGNDLTMHCSGDLAEMMGFASVVRPITLDTQIRLQNNRTAEKLHPDYISRIRARLCELIPEYGQ